MKGFYAMIKMTQWYRRRAYMRRMHRAHKGKTSLSRQQHSMSESKSRYTRRCLIYLYRCFIEFVSFTESVLQHQSKSRRHLVNYLFHCFIELNGIKKTFLAQFMRGKTSQAPSRKTSQEVKIPETCTEESTYICTSHQDVRTHSSDPEWTCGSPSVINKSISALPDIQFGKPSALVTGNKMVSLPDHTEEPLQIAYNHFKRCPMFMYKMRVVPGTFTVKKSGNPIESCKRMLKYISTNLREFVEAIKFDDPECLKENIEKMLTCETPKMWNETESECECDSVGIEMMKTPQVLIERLVIAIRKQNAMLGDLATYLEESTKEIERRSKLD